MPVGACSGVLVDQVERCLALAVRPLRRRRAVACEEFGEGFRGQIAHGRAPAVEQAAGLQILLQGRRRARDSRDSRAFRVRSMTAAARPAAGAGSGTAAGPCARRSGRP